MKKFSFSPQEIDANKASQKDWYVFVRRREVEMTFSMFSDTIFPLALEIGAGNGVQSSTIASHCGYLLCTEVDEQSHGGYGKTILERNLPNVKYLICDAQDLSQFGDKSFDLVYSSNVLEHIPDLCKCLSECRRVLKDDGIMAHTMPSRWWKVFYILLSSVQFKGSGIHGVSQNHLAEFYAFGKKAWRLKFLENGFYVAKIAGLPFYVGQGNAFISVIKAGNRMKLPGSYLYIVKKQANV